MCDVGKNIKVMRLKENMTQDQLAEKLYCTRQTVSNYENGKSLPDIDTLEKLALILNTNIDFLLYGPQKSSEKIFSFRNILIPLISLAALLIPYPLLISYAKRVQASMYYIGPFYFIKFIYQPVLFFLGGFVLLHTIFCFINANIPEKARNCRPVLKYILYFILGLLALIVLPPVFEFMIPGLKLRLYSIVLKLFGLKFSGLIINLVRYHPYIFALFGMAARFIFMPKAK